MRCACDIGIPKQKFKTGGQAAILRWYKRNIKRFNVPLTGVLPKFKDKQEILCNNKMIKLDDAYICCPGFGKAVSYSVLGERYRMNYSCEHEIEKQICQAQTDARAADAFIAQYMPFIRSETAKRIKRYPADGEDELSIAMFAFYESIMAYRPGRGAFLKLAAAAIKNRLIDDARKQRRHSGHLALDAPSSDQDERNLKDCLADAANRIEEFHGKDAAQKEIGEFINQLAQFDLTLGDVADNCPRQDRTLTACMAALDHARSHPELLKQLIRTKKLPIAQLSAGAAVERKTLERHRKYVVAILLAYTNGFEMIRGHLCLIKRREVLPK